MAIIISELCKTYKSGDSSIEAVRNVNLTIQSGEFLVLLGPSGGGKSTFLNLIGGMDRPTSGSVDFNGFKLEKASEDQLTRFRREKVGFVFQFFNLLPSLNALENTMLPLIAHGVSIEDARQRSAAILTSLGLQNRLKHNPARLSGGEQQRVAIARAVVGEPELVIADEPTGDLDSVSAGEIIALMHDLNKRLAITFVVATHNLALCEKADRVIEIKDGILHA